MTIPPAPQPQPARSPWYVSRFLLVVAAICFLFAALTVAGSDILSGPAWEWGFGGFCAWTLSGAVP